MGQNGTGSTLRGIMQQLRDLSGLPVGEYICDAVPHPEKCPAIGGVEPVLPRQEGVREGDMGRVCQQSLPQAALFRRGQLRDRQGGVRARDGKGAAG